MRQYTHFTTYQKIIKPPPLLHIQLRYFPDDLREEKRQGTFHDVNYVSSSYACGWNAAQTAQTLPMLSSAYEYVNNVKVLRLR
jgi:hypothetical protein